MARIARVVAPGLPHHVTQRGNRQMQTFFSDEDYQAYLALLVEWCHECGVRIWAYCLMPNHVHLIVVPHSEDALWRAIGETHRRYTRRVNLREGWRGHLWQGRFASFVMDEPYLLGATRYVERNPVKAKLCRKPWRWPWSSAAAHAAGCGDAVAEGDWLARRTAGRVRDWREFLSRDDEEELGARMRRAESTGRPLGEDKFVKNLETLLGRDLMPKKRGPKPKRKK